MVCYAIIALLLSPHTLKYDNYNNMKRIVYTLMIAACAALAMPLSSSAKDGEINRAWQNAVLAAVDSFPQNGGYYTGRKSTPEFKKSAWRAFNEAYNMRLADPRPNFDPKKATPSFCSLATYGAFIQALLIWDTDGKISRMAWFNIKPLVGITDVVNEKGLNQRDGEGCWGRANANGPGFAVLVAELKAGYNFTAFRGAKTEALRESKDEKYLTDEQWCNHSIWAEAEPGDFMKIFWNRNETAGSDSGAIIGVDNNPDSEQEHGHSVVFLGYDDNGDVKYWSSNGPTDDPVNAGYGIATCPRTRIQRVVFTRITNPENFDRAASKMKFNNLNKWLDALNGKRHGTTKELLKECGIK